MGDTPTTTPASVYLAMTAHAWGWSKSSEADAVKALREHAGSSIMEKFGYVTYSVHPDFQIDDINGSILTPQGHTPVKLTDKIKRKKKT